MIFLIHTAHLIRCSVNNQEGVSSYTYLEVFLLKEHLLIKLLEPVLLYNDSHTHTQNEVHLQYSSVHVAILFTWELIYLLKAFM